MMSPQTQFTATYMMLAVFVFSGGNAVAGIMLDTVPEPTYVAYSNQPQFDAIGSFSGGSSGTLIAPNWVLTAGHANQVDGFRVRGNGQVYSVAEIIQHPTFVANGRDLRYGYDLELVRLTSNVEGVTPATIYRGSSEVGKEISITGFGVGGTGSTGATLPHAQRAGTNIADALVSFADGNGNTGAVNAAFVADFDSEDLGSNTLLGVGSSPVPTVLEYHLAAQDSGGGVFIFENGQWFLAGVNSGVASARGITGNQSLSDNAFGYGAVGFFTRVSSYTGFIDSNITAVPEPTSLALVGLVAICVAGRKVLLRRKFNAS